LTAPPAVVAMRDLAEPLRGRHRRGPRHGITPGRLCEVVLAAASGAAAATPAQSAPVPSSASSLSGQSSSV